VKICTYSGVWRVRRVDFGPFLDRTLSRGVGCYLRSGKDHWNRGWPGDATNLSMDPHDLLVDPQVESASRMLLTVR
jgi:hypothetical protein